MHYLLIQLALTVLVSSIMCQCILRSLSPPQDDILFTVQIQNLMPLPVFLDVVSFEPAAGFTAVDLNCVQCEEERYEMYM